MRLVLAAAACLAALATPRLAAATPAIVPPLRLDVGTLALRGDAQLLTSTQLLVGVHWASLHPGDPSFDVGVGVVSAFTELPAGLMLPGGRKDADGYVNATGAYVELAKRIAGGSHWRTWLAGRGELTAGSLGGREFAALGAAARITTELFAGLAGSGSNAFILGAAGLGLYAEATYREQPAGITETGFGAGVSVRLPLIIAGN